MKTFCFFILTLFLFVGFSQKPSEEFLLKFETKNLPYVSDSTFFIFNVEDVDEDGNLIEVTPLPIEKNALTIEEVEALGFGSSDNFLYALDRINFPNGNIGLVFYHWSFSGWSGDEYHDYVLIIFNNDWKQIGYEMIAYSWDDNIDPYAEYDEEADYNYGFTTSTISFEKNIILAVRIYSERDQKMIDAKTFNFNETTKQFDEKSN